MKFQKPTLKATLVKRYKRFLADVKLANGEVITVHCPNSGSMKSCLENDAPVIISDSENPKRKLRYTWEMIKIGKTWIGINTSNPNQAVAEFIQKDHIPELRGYPELKREVRYGREGKSRIDILLSDSEAEPAQKCYIEIKNTTMRVDEYAAFPDAVTTRGQKHLKELINQVKEGDRACMFYFVGRSDCKRFRPADEIDPEYGMLLRKAVKAGVEVLAYEILLSPQGIKLGEKLPMDFEQKVLSS